MSTKTDRYIPIDEEGYFVFDGRRVDDQDLGAKLLHNIEAIEKDRFVTSIEGQQAWIEPFDEPLLARHVSLDSDPGFLRLELPYQTHALAPFESLSLDEWDRFHGATDKGIPFVLSRAAQIEFFELLEEFDDDSVTIQGRRIEVPSWLTPFAESQKADFWTGIYRNETPGWELGRESNVLPLVLPQLKLNRARVLVLGCGSGHDAAHFARQGHIVTAVDFSEEAIQRARTNYSSLDNLKIVQADAFNLPKEWNERFDLVFEHTCYCAVPPARRNELVKVWQRVLTPQGNLLGVFFAMSKRTGPPWGGSEWEVRERLKGAFDFMFWTRWRHSIENRKGRELVVYGRKKSDGAVRAT